MGGTARPAVGFAPLAAALLACAVAYGGCGPSDGSEPEPEGAASAHQELATSAEVGRSAEELEPAPAEALAPEASTGFTAAMHAEAMRLREGDPAEAAARLQSGCDRGYAPSCLALADMLERGAGIDADPRRAEQLLQQACFDGSSDACDRIGH